MRATPASRGTAFDPYTFAEQLGIHVIHRPIRTANELWLPDHSTIVIRSGLRRILDRAVLAHGLGHAVLGHQDDRPKHELLADRWAADQLIDPRELAALPEESSEYQVALELEVTFRLLRVWREARARA
jgi:Zn-dependent peptidase ImmA (M78 family)